MIPAPNVKEIIRRLEQVDIADWGPDDTRYVCILFWDPTGFRLLRNTINVDTWHQWHLSSGENWDLYLAGCYQARAGLRDVVLANDPLSPVYWSKRESDRLAHDVAAAARRHNRLLKHPQKPWTFAGPIELVAIGARRRRQHIEIDWASLRSKIIPTQVASQLGEAIAYYTETHVLLDADVLPPTLPAPGDFHDDLPGELRRDLVKHAGLVGKLFRRILGH